MYENEVDAPAVDVEFLRRRAAESEAKARVLSAMTPKAPFVGGSGPQVAMDTACSRQSAVSLLEQRARDLTREAEGLWALIGAMPRDLPREADEALWRLLCNQRR